MSYKRLEIYVGWTCNHHCTYCMEFPNMEKVWDKKVTRYEILKKLVKYRKQGFNHVTYLGGEPFIQEVFLDALKLGKKLGYTILTTTNCTLLHLERIALKYLPYIDELILSVEALDADLQKKISRTDSIVQWDQVFDNIGKHWNGKMLKANIVITKDNLNELGNIVRYLDLKGIKDISLTYPDLDTVNYHKEHVLEHVAPSYIECIKEILPLVVFAENRRIRLKLPDFPFCVFPEDDRTKYIKLTDDYDFETRMKVDHQEEELDRGNLKINEMLPRAREHCEKCIGCTHITKCWGPSRYYKELFGLEEINKI